MPILEQITKLQRQACICLTNIKRVEDAKKSNSFLMTHFIENWQIVEELISSDYKFIFLFRDPRDQLISYVYWMPMMDEERYPVKKISNRNELIKELITGEIYGQPAYEMWIGAGLELVKNIPKDRLLMIKFEDIIGPHGGATLEKQLYTIHKISQFIDYQMLDEKCEEIAKNSIAQPGTFRKGTIGQWKDYFTEEHIGLYKERYGELLIELGYEKDINW